MCASFFTLISTDVFIQSIAGGMHCILRLYPNFFIRIWMLIKPVMFQIKFYLINIKWAVITGDNIVIEFYMKNSFDVSK